MSITPVHSQLAHRGGSFGKLGFTNVYYVGLHLPMANYVSCRHDPRASSCQQTFMAASLQFLNPMPL